MEKKDKGTLVIPSALRGTQGAERDNKQDNDRWVLRLR